MTAEGVHDAISEPSAKVIRSVRHVWVLFYLRRIGTIVLFSIGMEIESKIYILTVCVK